MAWKRPAIVGRLFPVRLAVVATVAFRADTEPIADNADPLLVSLAAKITEAISACLQRGMQLPFAQPSAPSLSAKSLPPR